MKTHYDGDFDVLVLRGQLQLMKSEFKLRDDDLRDGERWTWRDVIPATNAVSEWSVSAVRRISRNCEPVR